MRNKIINALIEMGMHADLRGFYYIIDAILIIDEEVDIPKITWIYEVIANKNNATASKVERAIRHAFTSVLSNGNAESIEKYLTRQNATNGNLLHVFYLRLTQED